MRILLTAALAAAVLGGCTRLVTTSLPDQRVDDSYQVRWWTWQNGEQLTFAYKVFEDAGKVAICGARAESPGGDVHQRTFNERAVQTLSLSLGGETLANDISFFRKVRHETDAAPQGMAACVRTDQPWNTSYGSLAPELDAAKTRFRLRD